MNPLEEQLPVCDARALARLRKWGGEELLTELIALFVSEVPRYLRAARTGVRNEAPLETERAAHALRSNCGQVGALRAQALCALIESRAAGGDLTDAADLLDSLEMELARYLEEIPDGPRET
ncbi:MAG: Hpt domain-containing protein [Gemmatimonadetes bacterium]|nr:Hpt domain-containing protein [Gemmatimonadota bacterium]